MEPKKTTQQEAEVRQPEEYLPKTIQPEYTRPTQPKELEKPPIPPELPKEEKVYQESKEVPKTAQVPEAPPKKTEEGIDRLTKLLKRKKPKKTHIPQVRNDLTVQIEKILEEGLKDAYQELTITQKQEFKIKGEEITYEIQQLVGENRVKVKKIFTLILEWLKLLPGVNKFFLEQEAKIKADKIISVNNRSS
ncbi:MAG: hypothetical protein CL685_03325 [Candidatus Magasanikbacteria bacterium]|nr:hypothetical protein [Candidatus Magasanikbacteria bacterium]|tara:strand:- start:638 stop:1213 length:576 start_codon:yes stop_codon:yes gene_type:complete